MTTQQWNEHRQHIDEHISWPANKKEILDACEGMDVKPEVLDELKMKLTNSGKKYTKAELKKLLVMEM